MGIKKRDLEDLADEVLSIHGLDIYAEHKPSGWCVCRRLAGSSGCNDMQAGLSVREADFYQCPLVVASDLPRIKERDERLAVTSYQARSTDLLSQAIFGESLGLLEDLGK